MDRARLPLDVRNEAGFGGAGEGIVTDGHRGPAAEGSCFDLADARAVPSVVGVPRGCVRRFFRVCRLCPPLDRIVQLRFDLVGFRGVSDHVVPSTARGIRPGKTTLD
jgi:hypothetical protein